MSQQGLLKEGSSGAPNIETLTGNSGGAVGPDGAFNVNVVGSSPLTVTGNPGTNTLTIADDGTVPLTFTEDTGSATAAANNLNVLGDSAQGSVTSGATDTITITNSDASETQKGVVETSTDAESIAGTSTDVAVVPTSLKAKLGSQTSDGIPYGDGDTNAIQWTAAGTNGQLIIGATGAAPAFADLTSSGATIAITPGANSLNIEAAAVVPTTFETDAGSAAAAANNLDICGTASQGISTSGATNVVTITAADASTTQKGVLETSTNAESIAGTSSTVGVTPASLTAKLGTQTSNGLSYGGGTTSALNWLAEATNGQLPIGNTGNPPTLGTLTAGVGISITNGSGSITIDTANGAMDWTEVTVTGPTAMAVDNGYIANNAGVVGLTLPSTTAIGDIIKVNGKGAGGWSIAQNAGQTIHFLSQDTTTGVGGSLASTTAYDCVTLRCITANTDFVVEAAVGNITVT